MLAPHVSCLKLLPSAHLKLESTPVTMYINIYMVYDLTQISWGPTGANRQEATIWIQTDTCYFLVAWVSICTGFWLAVSSSLPDLGEVIMQQCNISFTGESYCPASHAGI